MSALFRIPAFDEAAQRLEVIGAKARAVLADIEIADEQLAAYDAAYALAKDSGALAQEDGRRALQQHINESAA